MTIEPEVELPALAVEEEPLPSHRPFRDFINFLDSELDSSHTVGAAYTIVHRGEVVYTGTYGESNRESHQQVDEHTLFRLASVSKGFAGVLASMLEQDGALSLSDRVVDHYPGFSLKDSISTADLTIRHLLSHTSGLVPYAFDNLVEAGQDLYTIIDRLDEVDISAPPGELYGYQNVLFSMLDPIARRSTGVPYQVLLQEKIFRPLGMEDASAGPVDLEKNPNMAYPHVRTRTGYVPLNPHEGYYNVLPAAGVNASISDMGQWLLGLLGYKPQWLPDAVLDSISTPFIYTPLKWQYTRYWRPFRERHYSLGWRIYHYQGREIIYHGGYIRGYRAEIAFCPSEDVGVAFLMNSPNSLASRCVPTFFDIYLD
ncbi:MAG: beta-lactamase family protein [Bacteroidales bacterium]|nr:beta-lactamase family protein [Bacteroidales bacterium]